MLELASKARAKRNLASQEESQGTETDLSRWNLREQYGGL